MDRTSMSALDIYMNRVFKFLIVFIPCVAISAGGTFSFIKFLGYYENVSWTYLIVFDCTCVLYVLIGLIFMFLCEDKEHNIKPRVIFYGKIYLLLLEFVQWNFITYVIPSRDFWAYSIFFVMLGVFFLDHKYLLMIEAEEIISLVISWIVRGYILLPYNDSFFVPEFILRIVLLGLSFVCLYIICYLVQKLLVSELEKNAEIDSLTRLKNRRNLSANLKDEMKHAKEKQTSFSLLMCDIDDFKKINDEQGHVFGDKILGRIAKIITHYLGDVDTAYRYGGEEFLVVVKGSEKEALTIAEMIRNEVESLVMQNAKETIQCTITIGVTTYHGESFSEDELIKHADANLYYGKKHGKNQVVV